MKNFVPPLTIIANHQAYEAFRKVEPNREIRFFENAPAALAFFESSKFEDQALPIALIDDQIAGTSAKELLATFREDPVLKSMIVFILGRRSEENSPLSTYSHFNAGFIEKPTNLEGYVDIASVLNNFWEICVFG